MTFNSFVTILAACRPDVHAHAPHMRGNDAAYTGKVMITFGASSKAYCYSGSYAEVLKKLGICVVTRADVLSVEEALEHAKKAHGKAGLFSRGQVVDNSARIAQLTELLQKYNSDEFVRDWE